MATILFGLPPVACVLIALTAGMFFDGREQQSNRDAPRALWHLDTGG